MKAAFTLVELIVALSVVTVLAALALPATSHFGQYAARTKAVSNMRQIGVASHLFAIDHDQQLPGQPNSSTGPDRWPKLFCSYLSPSDPRVFLDPTDASAASLPLPQVISNNLNNTGYIYNGFDDLASGGSAMTAVPLNRLGELSQVALIAQKRAAAKSFYVDPLDSSLANLLELVNAQAYDGGAYYLYVDGSVRFTRQAEYSSTCWLVDKSITLPADPQGELQPHALALRIEPDDPSSAR